MADITIVFMGFINQLITGGHHLMADITIENGPFIAEFSH